MCPCTLDHCRMSRQGSWSPLPSWPPSMSPCPWWRGGRTSWRSARTSWSQPSRPPAASGCQPRSSEKIRLVHWFIEKSDWLIGQVKLSRRSTSPLSPSSSGWSILPPAGELFHQLFLVCSGWTPLKNLLKIITNPQFALGEHPLHHQERGSWGGEVADCPAVSFVFVCWHITHNKHNRAGTHPIFAGAWYVTRSHINF